MIVMIVDEYDQRAVYKRYNVVDNGPDSVLELPVRFIANTTGFFYGRDEPYFVCAHKAIYSDRHSNQAWKGIGAMVRAPDCLTSHACVPGSNPADPVWGFQRNLLVSLFLM